ncbi:MAG: cell division protein ZapA [Thiotrichaceae bacterium]|nr:cell division protein ZapA [Thiotrichaceae bacterium]
MTDKTQAVSVKILEKEYKIACPEGEHPALVEAAKEVDTRMQAIRKSGKVLSNDRVAVMVALNLAHELLATRSEVDEIDETVIDQIDKMQDKISLTLKNCEQYDNKEEL